jgi:hypothetical protein
MNTRHFASCAMALTLATITAAAAHAQDAK